MNRAQFSSMKCCTYVGNNTREHQEASLFLGETLYLDIKLTGKIGTGKNDKILCILSTSSSVVQNDYKLKPKYLLYFKDSQKITASVQDLN